MTGPHQDRPLVTAGAPLDAAEAALVLVHGRGSTAGSIVQMADEFHRHGVAYFAPQAARNTWYPNRFTAPVESNEPGRSSGLEAIDDAVSEANDAGIPTERVIVLGFSQGACLACEYVARNPRSYGGLAVLSGGLIGESIDRGDYQGDLKGTPVFLGCSDVDPHIPEERVHQSAEVFQQLDGTVVKRLYEGMSHSINQDEREYVSGMVADLVE
ncbi:alpha/beta hydrolase [Haloarcula litorea]|uniref:alpha/beta hydrolase n=1 Tax=Haloarcula litorea TaxID=3032579 RepID=UPI0023E8C9C3|nr:dienelactone hydrolase family protein [Halomicroarcula sp. GDY20]